MNRENKKKSFEKNYYKTHPCNESFVCKVCGKTVVPTGAGSDHRWILLGNKGFNNTWIVESLCGQRSIE